MKRKIAVVISARASYARIKSLLFEINKRKRMELYIILIASAALSDYGDTIGQLRRDGLQVYKAIDSLSKETTLISQVHTTTASLFQLSKTFESLKPNMVVTIADRHETIATAIAASYMNIPLVHIQGGEKTGNIDDRVRNAITMLSDIHFVSTQKAKERLIMMGENKERIFVTGCPSCDIAIKAISKKIEIDKLKNRVMLGTPHQDGEKYYIVLQHSVTNEIDDVENQLLETLKATKKLDNKVYWILPNSDAGAHIVRNTVKKFVLENNFSNLCLLSGLDNFDFYRLLYEAVAIVGNSSVAIRECSFIGVPAVNIGNRQIGRECADTVLHVDYNCNKIYDAMIKCNTIKREKSKLYGDGTAGKQMADILEKCTLDLKENSYRRK